MCILNLFAAPESDLFTMKVNHVGHFEVVNGRLQYAGGEIDYFNKCDVDCMSMIDLEDLA